MSDCVKCGKPAGSDEIELTRERDGEQVRIHGRCYLKSYPATAYKDDNPKRWSGDTNDLDKHIDQLAEMGKETY